MLNSKLIKKSFNVLALRIAGVALMFFLSLFLTNYYSANLVGQYDFVRSTIMILSGISLLGTNQAIIYYSGILTSANSFGSIKAIYFKMISLVFIMCSILYIPLLLVSEEFVNQIFKVEESYHLIELSVQGLLFYTITMLNIDTIRALKKTVISELFRNLFRYAPFFIFSIILYIINKPDDLVIWFIYGFVLLCIATTILVFFLLFKKDFSHDSDKKHSTKEILITSYPMALSAISYFLMQSIDVLFLGLFETFETIAYYSVAVKLATVTSLALISVNIVIAPKIAKIYNDKNLLELKSMIRKATRINVLISVPLIFILFIFSDFILSMFGDNYILAKKAFFILLIAQFFNSISGPSALYLNMTGRQKKLNLILIVSLLINIVLNFILIPKHGMVGAAWATTISFIISKLIASVVVLYTDNVKTFIY
ncbi:MATE family efflux transporter [Flavobacteriaceae bacterium]|nr:MATE family efflux transporter [Flavobacteriaceae bacterium]MDB9712096.1 MATE family efflux transporter [Flavobacteriaceae bacterium]MDC1492203.1 MATE family efflux transporter [Flavobacteriaceae bacterium]